MRGIPLDAQTKEWFERRLHADLDHIRVHTYPAAHAAARMIGADAFAIGDDIFFAARRYQPRGAAGRELLAHELTHCLQQRL
ncbi:MAG TPA: DUF4157 domain-containing protein, partial [Bryobacteraceae bacterium]|nr:DUF4157 domain-containing protein [Bryobacteraceae bacterium]